MVRKREIFFFFFFVKSAQLPHLQYKDAVRASLPVCVPVSYLRSQLRKDYNIKL